MTTDFPEREELQACLDLLDGLRPFVQSGVLDLDETYNVALAHARQAAEAYRKAVLGAEHGEGN